jgi:hypothetical protein
MLSISPQFSAFFYYLILWSIVSFIFPVLVTVLYRRVLLMRLLVSFCYVLKLESVVSTVALKLLAIPSCIYVCVCVCISHCFCFLGTSRSGHKNAFALDADLPIACST